MKTDLIQVLDVLMDSPEESPDMNAISAIAAGTDKPIALMCALVEMLWLASEKPEEFDEAVCALYE